MEFSLDKTEQLGPRKCIEQGKLEMQAKTKSHNPAFLGFLGAGHIGKKLLRPIV